MKLVARRFAVDIELVRSKQSAGAAFTLACDASALEDKDIYTALGIDAGYFSNMKRGNATLRADLVKAFCDVVGNTAYIEWQAWQVGCTLVVTQIEAERQNQLLREENAALRRVLQGASA